MLALPCPLVPNDRQRGHCWVCAVHLLVSQESTQRGNDSPDLNLCPRPQQPPCPLCPHSLLGWDSQEKERPKVKCLTLWLYLDPGQGLVSTRP